MNVDADTLMHDGSGVEWPMVGAAGHARLSTMVAGYVAAALRTYALGDRVTWDAAVQIIPTPAGPRPMVLVYLSTPSAVLGELCGEIVLIEPQHVSADNVERNVSAAVERMRDARAAAAGAR